MEEAVNSPRPKGQGFPFSKDARHIPKGSVETPHRPAVAGGEESLNLRATCFSKGPRLPNAACSPSLCSGVSGREPSGDAGGVVIGIPLYQTVQGFAQDDKERESF